MRLSAVATRTKQFELNNQNLANLRSRNLKLRESRGVFFRPAALRVIPALLKLAPAPLQYTPLGTAAPKEPILYSHAHLLYYRTLLPSPASVPGLVPASPSPPPAPLPTAPRRSVHQVFKRRSGFGAVRLQPPILTSHPSLSSNTSSRPHSLEGQLSQAPWSHSPPPPKPLPQRELSCKSEHVAVSSLKRPSVKSTPFQCGPSTRALRRV